MKTERLPTRDVREDRCEREEKLGQAMETLPGKTLRDRFPNSRSTKIRAAGGQVKVRIPETGLSPNLMLQVVV